MFDRTRIAFAKFFDNPNAGMMGPGLDPWVGAQYDPKERPAPNTDYTPDHNRSYFPRHRLLVTGILPARIAEVETRGCMAETRRFRRHGYAVGVEYKGMEEWVNVLMDDGRRDKVPLRYFNGSPEFRPAIEYAWS